MEAPRPFKATEAGPSMRERGNLQVALAARYFNMEPSLAVDEWAPKEESDVSPAALFARYEQEQGTHLSYDLSEENLDRILTGMQALRERKMAA